MEDSKLYLEATEVCDMMMIARSTLQRFIKDNTRNFNDRVIKRIGKRRYIFDRAALIQWINESTNGEA